MRELAGLDFETYSAVDLPKHGLHRYVSSSTFTPLIASVVKHDPSTGQPFRSGWDLDFVANYDEARDKLGDLIADCSIVAHNAGFEQRVLQAMDIRLPSSRFIDSAVLARAAGAAGKLEAAAPQLLGVDKLEEGKHLIRLFSIPGKYQEESGSLAFDPRVIEEHPDEWLLFQKYCGIDAQLSLKLALVTMGHIPLVELEYQAITMDMNNVGWHVDVALVEEMQRRYLENQELALENFRNDLGAEDLNLNSLPQLKKWCADRGIKASSFDEKHVAKLMARIKKKLDAVDAGQAQLEMSKYQNYCEVLRLLETKQILGGSSLKKLQTILDTTGKDCRLRDQYLHVGAGQTYRTSGRGVQMQNLKRLKEPAEMAELYEDDIEWDNDKLAENIRQCFTATHPQGELIVGDFSSVESRGLAWQANETWKLEAYRQNRGVYEMLAAKMFHVPYEEISKHDPRRQTGKVGELSCGYNAGGEAVRAFAENMGVTLTEGEANALVTDWRMANPMIVAYWLDLDEALHTAVAGRGCQVMAGPGNLPRFLVQVEPTATPDSLLKQHSGAQSIRVSMLNPRREVLFTRVFHGVYERGRSLCYYKPSELKSGDLWKSHFTDPKTKQIRFYSVYGGKLAGILTQSLCREIFFRSLKVVHDWVSRFPNIELVGQFHDEIVLDWQPGPLSLEAASELLHKGMSNSREFVGFPMDAEIKHAYRYIK